MQAIQGFRAEKGADVADDFVLVVGVVVDAGPLAAAGGGKMGEGPVVVLDVVVGLAQGEVR